jgi:ferredoxin-like protein FixX
MSQIKPITVNVDAYLGLNKYAVDEGNAHINLAPGHNREQFLELVRACPAALYKVDDEGEEHFDFAGCLECGTCRIVGLGGAIADWRYPASLKGIEYRYG